MSTTKSGIRIGTRNRGSILNGTKDIDPVDIHVGKRIRLRRTIIDMSQVELAEAVDVSFQQVQKYEHGTNRVSASRLYAIAYVLNVPVSFFFEDYQGIVGVKKHVPCRDPMTRNESLELIKSYWDHPQKVRDAFRTLLATSADSYKR